MHVASSFSSKLSKFGFLDFVFSGVLSNVVKVD